MHNNTKTQPWSVVPVPVGGACCAEAKDTPLQEKLETMASQIGYFGFVFAGLTFVAMIVSWFADNDKLEGEYK